MCDKFKYFTDEELSVLSIALKQYGDTNLLVQVSDTIANRAKLKVQFEAWVNEESGSLEE